MVRPQNDLCGSSSMPQQGQLDQETIRMVQMILERFKSCDCAECKKPLGHQNRLEPNVVLCSSACLASFEGKHKGSSSHVLSARKDTGTLTVPCGKQDVMTSYSRQNIEPATGNDATINVGELIMSNQAMEKSNKMHEKFNIGKATDDVLMIEEVDQVPSNPEMRENQDLLPIKVVNLKLSKSASCEPEVVFEVKRSNTGPSNYESASGEKSKDKYLFRSIHTAEVNAGHIQVARNEAPRMNARIETVYEEPRRHEIVQCEEPSTSRARKQRNPPERRVEVNSVLLVNKTREEDWPVQDQNRVTKQNLSKNARSVLRKALSQPPPSPTQNHAATTVVLEQPVNILKRLPGKSAADWTLSRRLLAKPDEVSCIIYDRTGNFVITGGDNGLVMVWNAARTTPPKTLAGGRGKIVDIAVNVENSMVVAGSTDGFVVVWSLQQFSVVATLPHTGQITTVGFCPMPGGQNFRNYLMVTASNSSVHFWSYHQAPGQAVFFDDTSTVYEEKFRPGPARIICSSFSSGGVFLAVGAADKHVRVYYMLGRDGPENILQDECYEARVDCISFAHTGLNFVSGSKDGTAILHKYEYGLWRKTRMVYKSQSVRKNQSVTMVAWNLDDSRIVTAHADGALQLWDSLKGKPRRCLMGHNGRVYLVDPHPIISSIMLSAGEDGKIILWEVATPHHSVERVSGRRLVTELISEESSPVNDCKISPDGKGCAAIKASGEILIFSEAKTACDEEATSALHPNEYAIPVLPPTAEHVIMSEEEYYQKHRNVSLVDQTDGIVDSTGIALCSEAPYNAVCQSPSPKLSFTVKTEKSQNDCQVVEEEKHRLSFPSSVKRIKFSDSEELQPQS